MKRILWVLGLTLALSPVMGLSEAQAQTSGRDSVRARARPNAALLMRLARARQLSNRPLLASPVLRRRPPFQGVPSRHRAVATAVPRPR